MGARQKIEELTAAWYGYALFAGLVGWIVGGLGAFRLLWTVGGVAFSLFLYWFLGQRLLAKSGFVRLVLLVVSAISSVASGLGAFKLATNIFSNFSLSGILLLGLAGATAWMNIRSFVVLRDPEVKLYFR